MKKKRRSSRFKATFRMLQRMTWVFLSLLIITLMIYAGNRFYRHLKNSPLFRIRTVSITGNHTLSKTDLIYYMGLTEKLNLLNLDIGALYHKLTAHPWIKDATIRRRLPGTLTIHIRERVPVALIMIGKLYYLDRDGVVFDKINKEIGCDFPVFTGPRRYSQLSAYRPLITEALPLVTKKTSQLISEIHLDLNHGITLVTLNDAVLVKLGFQDLPRRLHRFLSTYHYLRRREIVTKVIDCRYPDRVVVKYATPQSSKSPPGGRT